MRRLLLAAVLTATVVATPASAGAAALLPAQTLSAASPALAGYDANDASAVIDGAGNATVIYRQKFNNTKPDEVMVVRRAPGGAFSAPVALSDPTKKGTLAQAGQARVHPIGVDSAGNVTVAYSEQTGTTYSVWARTAPPGGDFGAPVSITAPPAGTLAGVSAVIVAPNGATAVLYSLAGKLTARTRPAGSTAFAAAVTIHPTSTEGYSAGADSSGQMTVVYDTGFGGHLFAATAPAGGSFSAGVQLSAANPVEASTVVEPDGRTSVFYRDTANDLLVVTRLAGSTLFGSSFDLHVSTSSDPPVALLAPDGTTTVAWATSNGNYLRTWNLGAGPVETVVGSGSNTPWTGGVDAAGQLGFFVTNQVSGKFQTGVTVRPTGGAAFGPVLPFRPLNTSTGANFQVLGASAGNFLVMSSAKEVADQADSLVAAWYDAAPPEIRFAPVLAPAIGGIGVGFSTGMAVDAFDFVSGHALSIHWDFGDGTGADGSTVSHAWAARGNYTVTASATDAAGNTAAVSAVVPVLAGDPLPPVPPIDPPLPPAPAPHSKLGALPKKPKAYKAVTLKGTATNAARVDVSISQKSKRRCTWVTAKGKTSHKRSKCPTVWLKAKGTAKWSLKLKKGLPAGTWTVRSRATSAAGKREKTFSAKLGNQRSLKVR